MVAAAAAGALVATAAGAAPHYPQQVQAAAEPTPAQTAAVERAFGKEFADIAPFVVGQADLNGDGRPDLVIMTHNRDFCGSAGCAGYAVLATAGGYAASGIRLAYSSGSVTVLPSTHHGMHDLRFDDTTHTFTWNGRQYQ